MWSKTEKMWSKLTITVYEDTECSDHSGNRANRKNCFFPFDIGTQNFYQLLLSSEIGLFEVENMVRNWIFVGNLVQYWFPFVKHGVFCKVKSAISQFWTTFPTSNGAISELRRSWKKFRVPISKGKKQFFRLVRFPEWSEHSNPMN